MPFTWKEMWTYDWGHKIHFFKKNHPWNAEWQASPYNKNPATTPAKGPASKRPAHESGAQIVVSQYASKHYANIGVDQPCHADTCDIFTCVNSMKIHYTTYKEADWLKDEGRARVTNRDRWLGLYARREVPPKTWIASFGPLLWSAKRPDNVAANCTIGENGYSMYFTNKPTPLGYTTAWGNPNRDWPKV